MKIKQIVIQDKNGPNKRRLMFVLYKDTVDMVLRERTINFSLNTILRSQIPKFTLHMEFLTRILKWKISLMK